MIHLEKLTYENFDDVFELKVKKVQYPFVASNCCSVAEAYVTMMSGFASGITKELTKEDAEK